MLNWLEVTIMIRDEANMCLHYEHIRSMFSSTMSHLHTCFDVIITFIVLLGLSLVVLVTSRKLELYISSQLFLCPMTNPNV